MSAQDSAALWSSVPWTAAKDAGTDGLLGWHKHHVPYVPEALSLQNLDVWIPPTPDSGAAAPAAASLPTRPGRWIIFIHGGAWRDPRVSSSAFEPAAHNLLRRIAAGGDVPVAGLASLNYRLSAYPNRPSDPSREAVHPGHVADVLAALVFLQGVGGATDGYILSGHSCGATLAFQASMAPSRWAEGLPTPLAPAVLVGLNGLYDLEGFVANPPASHADLAEGYEEFTRGAFGPDRAVWRAACPATAQGWVPEWKRGRKVVLVQSREDTLVPYEQLDSMRGYLVAAHAPFAVEELTAGGDHDEIWQKGTRLAEIYEEVLTGLV